MSSVEDAAPRKGSAPTLETYSKGRWSGESPREMSASMSDDEATSLSHRRDGSRVRREPPRLDLSRLFARRKSSKTSNKASPLPTPSAMHEFRNEYRNAALSPQLSWYQTTNPWGIRIRKPKSPGVDDILTPRVNGFDVDDEEYQSPKIHVRRPPPGIQHWFDGVEDDDTASVQSEPEGRPSMSPSRSLSKNRDTFLSISTNVTQNFAPEVVTCDSPLEHQDYFSRHRTDTITSTSTQQAARPNTRRSHSSAATLKHSTQRKHQTSCHHHHLPESINKGQSVLVLSETEDSDDDEDDHAKELTGGRHGRTSFDDGSESIDHKQIYPGRLNRGRVRLPRDTDYHGKKLHNVPDLVSTTSIEDGSQQTDDDHSPRTSLLSDLRPISFRSEYRPISFKTEHDRPISIQTYESDEHQAWLASESSSQITPPPDLSYLTDQYLSVDGSRPTPRSRSPQPQRLMVVTDEEATLLANMRRRRAEMARSMASGQDAAPRPATALPTTTTFPHTRTRPHGHSQSGKGDEHPTFSPAMSLASEAACLSPLPEGPRRKPSTDTVTRVWEDVQRWRKHGPTLQVQQSARRRPSLPVIMTAPATTQRLSHFSSDSEGASPALSPRSRPAAGPRMRSETVIRREQGLGRAGDAEQNRRSRSFADALKKRETGNDVKADVLAAWGDLGGWRRSVMSVESGVDSVGA